MCTVHLFIFEYNNLVAVRQTSKLHTHTHTHTLRFNGLFCRTTWVSQHKNGKPFWISIKQEMMGGSGIS